MLRYALYDIRASILSTDRFFFGVALPIVFFLLFGAMQDYSSQQMGDGNVALRHDWHGAVRCCAEHRGD